MLRHAGPLQLLIVSLAIGLALLLPSQARAATHSSQALQSLHIGATPSVNPIPVLTARAAGQRPSAGIPAIHSRGLSLFTTDTLGCVACALECDFRFLSNPSQKIIVCADLPAKNRFPRADGLRGPPARQ